MKALEIELEKVTKHHNYAHCSHQKIRSTKGSLNCSLEGMDPFKSLGELTTMLMS